MIRSRALVSLFFILMLVVSSSGYSQFQPTPVKRSGNQISISGKNFYLHEVLKGQTLYGIAKAYDTSEEEIRKLNPDLVNRSIFAGMVLRIPDPGTNPSSSAGTPFKNLINHTVLAKENLYSISRQYGVKVDEIRELNPETRGGLKIGQVIKIPGDRITIAQKPKISEAVAIQAETQESIPAEVSRNIESPCMTEPFPHIADQFRLAVLLPLNISQHDTLFYSDTLNPEYFRFYEFLEGIYLAIDSMRLEGMDLTVEVFDTERNPETIRGIIESGKLRESDLIIGPVFPNEIDVVMDFSKENQIPMVSPFSYYDAIRNNPVVFQVRNRIPRQVELVTQYLGTKSGQNIVLLGRQKEKSDSSFIRFREDLGKQILENNPAKQPGFKTVYYNETTRGFVNGDSKAIQIDTYLSATSTNYIILTSENEVFTTEMINLLQQKAFSHPIHVFGLNQWVFRDLDLGNLYNVNLELYSDFEDEDPFLDFSDAGVMAFCRKYEENWNIEPSRYSFHGFDIAYYFTRALYSFGRNLTASVPCWAENIKTQPMLTPLRFQAREAGSGFENIAITVFRYEKDLLIRKKVN